MTIFLDCMSPCSSSVLRRNATYRKARRAAVSPSLPKGMFWSCFRWGLHSLPCYQGSGGLLHHHSTLTGIPRRFLCTGLGVTPTGRYPAPCPVKPGLSSPQKQAARPSVLLTVVNFNIYRQTCQFTYFCDYTHKNGGRNLQIPSPVIIRKLYPYAALASQMGFVPHLTQLIN